MKFKINDLVSDINFPKIKGKVTAIFKDHEEYCSTDIGMYKKSKDYLKIIEKPYSEKELTEIFYFINWGKENGQSLHCESRLVLRKTQGRTIGINIDDDYKDDYPDDEIQITTARIARLIKGYNPNKIGDFGKTKILKDAIKVLSQNFSCVIIDDYIQITDISHKKREMFLKQISKEIIPTINGLVLEFISES